MLTGGIAYLLLVAGAFAWVLIDHHRKSRLERDRRSLDEGVVVRGPWQPRAVKDERWVQSAQRPRSGLVDVQPRRPPASVFNDMDTSDGLGPVA